VRDFRGAWESVCAAAGVPGLLFHDLRRTAARNLRRAGVAETVIMKIGGWRTSKMFRRYAIVCDSDLSDAMSKLEVSQRSEKAQQRAQDALPAAFGHPLVNDLKATPKQRLESYCSCLRLIQPSGLERSPANLNPGSTLTALPSDFLPRSEAQRR